MKSSFFSMRVFSFLLAFSPLARVDRAGFVFFYDSTKKVQLQFPAKNSMLYFVEVSLKMGRKLDENQILSALGLDRYALCMRHSFVL
ncbi:MAG: hypothetical protein PUJ93_05580 [Oscillospiraceae bacterium]|nr:hypothetical protein [Oscillospiraceae bacterium]